MKIALLIVSFLSSFCINAQSENLLQDGAKLYEQRENIENVHKALELFNKKIELDSKSAEAHWRASMAHYYIGNILEDRKQRKKHFQKGVELAEKCKKLTKGKLVDCHFWLGTNVALLKQEKGLVHMAFGLKEIFKHFEKCKKLDPNYASAGPYRMLALLSYKAPGFLGGDSKKAYKYIDEAIKRSPNEPLNIHIKAQFLIDDDKQDEAIKLISNFLKTADPQKFEFFESKSSFTEMKYFLENKKWPKV